MRAAGLLVVALATSCTIAEDQDIVLECFAPEPGVYVGQTVQLNAQIADRPPGQFPEEYTWELIDVPEGGAVRLDRADERDPTFVPVVPGPYTAQVNVVDFDGTPAGPCEVTYDVAPEPIACGDGTTSVDYEAGECPPSPLVFVVTSDFRYNAQRESVVPYGTTSDEEEQPVTVTVEVGDPFVGPLCQAVFTVDGEVPRADWVDSTEPAVWFGFDIPDDAAVDSDCAGAGLDAAIFGDDPDAFIRGLDLGITVSPLTDELAEALEPAVEQQLGAGLWAAEWEPFVFSSGLRVGAWSDRPSGGRYEQAYAFAYELDDDGYWTYDDENENGMYDDGEALTTLPAATSAATMPSGHYSSGWWFFVDARCGYDPLLCQ